MDIYTPMVESMFDGMVAVEEVNEENLQKLINSDLLLKVYNNFNNKNYENEMEQLRAFQQICKDGYAYVKHSKTDIGRSMPNKGLSLLNIRRQIRQTIANHDGVVDIDMDNCHPVILVQILQRHKIPHASLLHYVKNRQLYRDTIYKCWKLDRYKDIYSPEDLKDMTKYLMIRLMYNGTIAGWELQNKLKSPKKIPQILTNFINEFKNICDVFESKNPHIKAAIENKKDYNIQGSITSSIMQQKESQLLEVVTKYMIRRRYIETVKPGFYKFAPCADGLIVSKKNIPDQDVLLNELKVTVYCETGLNIDFSIKAMTQHYCVGLDDHVIKQKDYEIDNSRVDKIINESDLLFKSYTKTKYYNSKMVRSDVNTRNINLFCSDCDLKCVLCDVVHKENRQKLYYNENGHACLSCHKKKIIIEKIDKNEEARNDRNEEGLKYIHDFYEVKSSDRSLAIVINEDSKYLSCDINNRFQWRPEYDNPFLVLDAQMGKGKTQFIKKFLERKSGTNPSILVISQRKSFTHFICDELKEYNIKSYLDIKKDYDTHQSICIQIESLHKISTKTKKYDFVILDECETVFNQFSSSTMKFVNDNYTNLEYFVSSAAHTIFADAFITTRTMQYINTIKSRREYVTVLKNTKLFLDNRDAIQIHGDGFKAAILEALAKGKKIAVVSTNREDLLDIDRSIRTDIRTKHLKVKYYDKNSDKEDLKDVNESWSDADVVLYTPVITTGISYTNEDHVFDTIYINCKNTCQARDLMQMAMRIRNLRDNKIYFTLTNRQMFGIPCLAFKTFDEFSNDIRVRGAALLHITSNEALRQKITSCITTYNKSLLRIMYYNIREQCISSKYFQLLCLYLFKKQGYNVVQLDGKTTDLKVEKEKLNYEDEYALIESLDWEDVDSLKNSDKCKETQMKIDKYYFENMLIRDLEHDVKSKLFFDYYLNSYKKHVLTNVRLEKSKLSLDQLITEDIEKNDFLINKMTLKGLKLNHIQKLNKILNMDSSCHSDKVVVKNNSKIMTYLKKNVDSINVAFSSNYKFVERNNVKNNLTSFTMLERIYGSWSGLKFKVHEKNSKGAKSYITNCDPFINYLEPIKPKKTLEETFLECE